MYRVEEGGAEGSRTEGACVAGVDGECRECWLLLGLRIRGDDVVGLGDGQVESGVGCWFG